MVSTVKVHVSKALFILALIAGLTLAAPPAGLAQDICAAAPSIAIRQGQGAGYTAVGYVLRGQCPKILGLSSDGNWYQVPQGWVWAAPHLWTSSGAQLATTVVAPGPAPSAPSSGGNGVTVQSWVSNPAPDDAGEVVVYAGIAINGIPRAGIPVQFVWRFPGTTAACTAVTESDGVAACVSPAGGLARGVNVPVVGSFRAYGRDYTSVTSFTPNGACEPAYPDFCLQPGLPDLNCADIPYRHFLVLAPDPHGFDGDGDSVGC
jgi:hypothetical protein